MGLARARRIRDRVVAQWKAEGKKIPKDTKSKKRKADPIIIAPKRVKHEEITAQTALNLRKAFSFNSEPTVNEINALAGMIGLSSGAVTSWFEARRNERSNNINVSFVMYGQPIFATSIPNFPRKHKKLKRAQATSEDEADWERLGRSGSALTARQRSVLDRKLNPYQKPVYLSKRKQLTEEEELKKAEKARRRAITEAEKLRRLKEETIAKLLESEDTARTRKEEKNAKKAEHLKRLRQSNPYTTIRYVSRAVKTQDAHGKVISKIENRLAMPIGRTLISTGRKLQMVYAHAC